MEYKDGSMAAADFASSAKFRELTQQDLERAFAEVYQILWHATEEVWLHVPYAFRKFLYDYMDKSWCGELDFSKTINEMNLLRQTRVLLSLVYRDFLCTDEEREDLIEKDREAMKAQSRVFKYESLMDLLPSGYYIPENYSFSKYYSEEISKSEPECLVRFLSNLSHYNQKGSRNLLLTELLAHALIMISRIHTREIRKERGDGWRCGVYKNSVYNNLSQAISTKYSDSQIIAFIDFCNACCDCKIFLDEADIKIKAMMEDLLSMRPAPIIYPINTEDMGDGKKTACNTSGGIRMDYTQEYLRGVEEIRRNERSLLIHFVAEKYEHNQIRARKLSSAELISRSLMSIRAEYANVIKKHYGGWTCGTHANKVEERLRRTINERYTESQINRFIDFCLTTHEADDMVDACADADIRDMVEYLLSIRPKPSVNLFASY